MSLSELTDEQIEHVLRAVERRSGLREALRLCCGQELTDELRDWLLRHPTFQQNYLDAKQNKRMDHSVV